MSIKYAARVLCAVVALCTAPAFTSAQTITDIVASSGEFDDNRHDYDILLDFVLEAGLAETLSTQGAASGTSEITGAQYQFGEAELSVYGERELQTLERMLREAQPEALAAVHDTICRKIGWDPGAGDERAFLEAFYAQLRAKLEGDMRFGKRKADKFS